MGFSDSTYTFFADLLLISHVVFVAFIIIGLAMVFIGAWLQWSWVRNTWFRAAHLGGILFVVVQAWAGKICPLTIWEMQLRQRGGQESYQGSFIQHWLHQLLYYDAPAWVFTLAYTLFGIVVVASWVLVKPGTTTGPTAGKEST